MTYSIIKQLTRTSRYTTASPTRLLFCKRSLWHFVLNLFVFFPFHIPILSIDRCSLLIMPDTCIRFGKLGARVVIEDKEVEHYNIQVDPAKKEVEWWIASEAGKVCESLFAIVLLTSCSSKAFEVVWLEFDMEYPCNGTLYLDGHFVKAAPRLHAVPMIFGDFSTSESSCVPFLFSPLVVTGEKALLLPADLEMMVDATRWRYIFGRFSFSFDWRDKTRHQTHNCT